MKTLLTALIFSICLIQTYGAAVTCAEGFADYGLNYCYQCHPAYKSCFMDAGSIYGAYKSSFTGFKAGSGTVSGKTYDQLYCVPGFYNSKTNNCDLYCATGCRRCYVDTNFCTTCHQGYILNNNTCLPAVIGLQAASLALLFITLIFSIIGCCYVNKARK